MSVDEQVTWVVSSAMQKDPALEREVAEEMAARAVYLAEQQGEPDAPSVARTLLEDFPERGASAVSVVARAAVDLVTGQQP